MKNHSQKPYRLLQPNEIPEKPWDIITCDLITQLPKSDRYNAICIVVDRLTKRAHFFAHNDNCTSSDVAGILFNKVFTLHGLPKQIVSDRGWAETN